MPVPPAIVSLPSPPSSVVGMLSVKSAVALVDTHVVVAGSGLDGDLRDLAALEAEVGRPVVAEVHLQDAGIAGLQSKRDLVAPLRCP